MELELLFRNEHKIKSIIMQIHINEIKLKGEGKFIKQFNLCSDYYQKSNDTSLSKEERKKYLDLWFNERQRLELGMY